MAGVSMLYSTVATLAPAFDAFANGCTATRAAAQRFILRLTAAEKIDVMAFDFGIAKAHFELGAGGGKWEWGNNGEFTRSAEDGNGNG